MPTLDLRGKIAAAEIAFYAPLTIITAILTFRYGFRRDAGWLFLFIFSLARLAGGALIVAGEMVVPTKIDLFIAAYALFPGALGLLMLSTLGFLGLAGQHSYSEYLRTTHILRVLGITCMIAMGLSIAGVLLGTHVSPKNAKIGLILRRAGAGVYGGLYVAFIAMHLYCLYERYGMKRHRRRLLYGVCVALPLLGVRVAYGILDAWSASDQFGTQPSSNKTLARFNDITGEWIFFLVMGLIMEFATAALYLLSSTILSRRHHY
ncbi:hypothetical protein C8J56DRAFT_918125 [Mycena floridula]|nr:hypothetical protein C8J56DRAFT_918125 [Mycena floridula]